MFLSKKPLLPVESWFDYIRLEKFSQLPQKKTPLLGSNVRMVFPVNKSNCIRWRHGERQRCDVFFCYFPWNIKHLNADHLTPGVIHKKIVTKLDRVRALFVRKVNIHGIRFGIVGNVHMSISYCFTWSFANQYSVITTKASFSSETITLRLLAPKSFRYACFPSLASVTRVGCVRHEATNALLILRTDNISSACLVNTMRFMCFFLPQKRPRRRRGGA